MDAQMAFNIQLKTLKNQKFDLEITPDLQVR
jgi:hypothetical protein